MWRRPRLLGLVLAIGMASGGGCRQRDSAHAVPARPEHPSLAAGFTGALTQAESGVRRSPQSSPAWLQLGELYLANGFAAEARVCLQRAVEDQATGARAVYGLSLVAQRSGDLTEEIHWLRETIARDASYGPAHLRLARAAYKSGDPATAVAYFEKVLHRDPDNAEALIGIARERSRLGDHDGARKILERLTTLHPKFSTAFAMLATITEGAGDPAQAATLRARARERKDPPPADPWQDEIMASCFDVHQLALRFEDFSKSGLEDSAVATLRRIETIAPEHPLVLQVRALALVQQGRDDEAVREYERALAAGGEARSIYPALVGALLRLKRIDAAEHQARAGMAAAPDAPAVFSCLADVRIVQRNPEEAAALLEQAAALAPEDVAVHSALARLHAAANRWPEAVSHLEAVRRLAPSDFPARAMLGQFLLEARRPREALPPLQEALALAPDDARIQELLALAHVRVGNDRAREGNFDEALTAYAQAIDVRPATMEAHANRVQIYLRLRRTEQADAALQAWLANQPDEPAAWVMLGDVQSATGKTEQSVASWSRARTLLAANPNPQLQDALAARLNRVPTP